MLYFPVIDLRVVDGEHRFPAVHGMARAAIRGARNMTRTHARGRHAVMTGGAAALYFLMIEMGGGRPGRLRVTGLATRRTQYMVLPLESGADARTLTVARDALAGRPFEYGADMA